MLIDKLPIECHEWGKVTIQTPQGTLFPKDVLIGVCGSLKADDAKLYIIGISADNEYYAGIKNVLELMESYAALQEKHKQLLEEVESFKQNIENIKEDKHED